MDAPPVLPPLVCPRCGASNAPHATRCWLCSGHSSQNPYESTAPLAPKVDATGQPVTSAAERRNQRAYAWLLAYCCFLAILIGYGIARKDQGLLVPYAILISPAFLVTGVRAAYDASQQRVPQPSKLLLTLLWSGISTILVLGLIAVASIIGLTLMCLNQLR